MPLATILGVFLWLFSPPRSIAPAVHAISFRQDTQTQGSQPNTSSQQSSPASPESDQQKVPEQPTVPQPTATSPPCPENSHSGSSEPGSSGKLNCTPEKSTGATTKKHHRTHKPATPAGTDPNKTVIRNGGTTEPTVDLSPSVNERQASLKLDETNKRLAVADANLKTIVGRQLSASQQDTVRQIKNYMEQAKTAAAGGDVQRAYNLAVKAKLLSAELAGR
jgi:hypothetical protein